MSTTLETARLCDALRLPIVIVPPGRKGPIDDDWQNERYPLEEIELRFGNNPKMNVGLILGPASRVIDLERDTEEGKAGFAELFAGCQVPLTPSWDSRRGPHDLFAWDDRFSALDSGVIKCMGVECRLGGEGKGIQSLLPPSTTDGYTRKWINPLSADCKPAPLPEEVIQRILAAKQIKTSTKPTRKATPLDTSKPGDDFCQRATWQEILEPHKWAFDGESNGTQHWRRPGKSDGLSATTGHCQSQDGRDLFYVFSENAPPFVAGECYNKFSAYALLNHAGDFKAAAAALADKGYGKRKAPSASGKLLKLVADAEVFHDPAGDSFATVAVGDHQETYGVETKAFKRWLEHRYYQRTKSAPPSKALSEALGVIAARARFEGKEIPVHTRLGGLGDAIYLDLGNDKWEAVEITADGWNIVPHPPVKFRRPNGLLPLPYPQRGGSIDELRRFTNVDDDSFPLLASGLVADLRPTGPYPVILFNAEHGSCKSTTMRVCRQLIDPNKADLRSAPHDVQTLMLAATNGWFVCLDNMSGVAPWLSDAVCRLSTGGGLGMRSLYTNDEEKLFDCQRPVMVTGIAELTTREDFLDRSVIIRCPPMPAEKRIDEKRFYAEFELARPRIMGALLTAASAALKNLPTTKLPGLPRMADYCLWSVASEVGLGWQPGTFLKAYDNNRLEANDVALDNPLADAIRALMEPRDEPISGLSIAGNAITWQGTASPLLDVLTNHCSTPAMRANEAWPRGANALSGKLTRMKVNLRKAGISVDQHRRMLILQRSLSA